MVRFRTAARAHRGSRNHLILDGVKLIHDTHRRGAIFDAVIVSALALRNADTTLLQLVRALESDNIEVVAASESVMAAVSPVRSPSNAVALMTHRPVTLEHVFSHNPTESACVIAPTGVQDPGNLGAIIRAADASGANGVAVTNGSTDPYGWKALRGAMGSTFRLPVSDMGDLEQVVTMAHTYRYRVSAALPHGGRSVYDADLTGSLLLLIGNEGSGLERASYEMADEVISVPMAPSVESLNVAVAAAVLLYEVRRQRSHR